MGTIASLRLSNQTSSATDDLRRPLFSMVSMPSNQTKKQSDQLLQSSNSETSAYADTDMMFPVSSSVMREGSFGLPQHIKNTNESKKRSSNNVFDYSEYQANLSKLRIGGGNNMPFFTS